MLGRTSCRIANVNTPIMKSLANIFMDSFSTFSRTLYALCGLDGWTPVSGTLFDRAYPTFYDSADWAAKTSKCISFLQPRAAIHFGTATRQGLLRSQIEHWPLRSVPVSVVTGPDLTQQSN